MLIIWLKPFFNITRKKDGKGSYNDASFSEVKEIESKLLEAGIDDIMYKLKFEKEDYQEYKNDKHY